VLRLALLADSSLFVRRPAAPCPSSFSFPRPQVIMMLVTVFMAVVMPKLMNNMDPQELAEMQKMQSSFSVEGLRKKLEAKASEIQEAK